jgi:hypothetical protein
VRNFEDGIDTIKGCDCCVAFGLTDGFERGGSVVGKVSVVMEVSAANYSACMGSWWEEFG